MTDFLIASGDFASVHRACMKVVSQNLFEQTSKPSCTDLYLRTPVCSADRSRSDCSLSYKTPLGYIQSRCNHLPFIDAYYYDPYRQSTANRVRSHQYELSLTLRSFSYFCGLFRILQILSTFLGIFYNLTVSFIPPRIRSSNLQNPIWHLHTYQHKPIHYSRYSAPCLDHPETRSHPWPLTR